MDKIVNTSVSPSHTIFLVEEDNDARDSLTKNLRQFGYRLLVSANVEDATEWLSGGVHIHADLLLIDLVGKLPEDALRAGQRLRSHAKYNANTPLVVMPEKISRELEGTDKNVTANDWICYYQDADQLQRLIARLLSTTPFRGFSTVTFIV